MAALTLTVLAAPVASAEPTPAADELHKQAEQALHDGDLEAAATHLKALWAMEKSLRSACDLAVVYIAREDWTNAAAMMERCTGFAGDRAGDRIRTAHRTAMERVQRLDIVTDPDGAQVEASGAAKGDKSLYLAPGSYELVVSHPGYLTIRRQLTAVAGGHATYELTLVRDPSAPAAPEPGGLEPARPPEPSAEEPDYSVRNWVVIGAGVVAVGSFVTAILFNAKASSSGDRWHELGGDGCSPVNREPSCLEANDVWSDWRSQATTRNVFFGVGVGAAALGVVAYLLWPEPEPKTGRLTHGFDVGIGGGQWVVSGSF